MSILERALAAVAPGRALRRAEARAKLARVNHVRALYEGAGSGRRTQHWRAPLSDANSEVAQAGEKLRAIARDMVRNNPYAERARATIRNNVIGAGIQIGIKGSNERAVQAIKDHLESTDIDADGQNTIYGLQALVVSTVVESGECLIRYRPRLSSDGYALPFQLQVLEPDFLDIAREGPLPNGNYAHQGIEFDLRGQRVAYYLFSQHPGAVGRVSLQSTRVSADFVAHIYRVDRPGQARGVTWFAPVILRMRDFADFTDAQLVRQKIAACFAGFITQSEAIDVAAGQTDADGKPVELFEPGMVERLREGESITFANPPTIGDFEPYTRATLREIAAGLGITYEAFTGDLSNVNYSSGRMGWLEFQRSIDVWRGNMVVPQMCFRVEDWTLRAAEILYGASDAEFNWTPPRRTIIDPQTEIAAAKDAIRSGLSSRQEEARSFGWNPSELEREIAEDNATSDANGFVFDSDARQVTTRGVAQKNADPNAPDPGGPPSSN